MAAMHGGLGQVLAHHPHQRPPPLAGAHVSFGFFSPIFYTNASQTICLHPSYLQARVNCCYYTAAYSICQGFKCQCWSWPKLRTRKLNKSVLQFLTFQRKRGTVDDTRTDLFTFSKVEVETSLWLKYEPTYFRWHKSYLICTYSTLTEINSGSHLKEQQKFVNAGRNFAESLKPDGRRNE